MTNSPTQLGTLLPTLLQSHLLAAEVALRKGRLVVALGAVRKAAEVAEGGAAHPDVHVLVVRLALAGGEELGPRRRARAHVALSGTGDEGGDSCTPVRRGRGHAAGPKKGGAETASWSTSRTFLRLGVVRIGRGSSGCENVVRPVQCQSTALEPDLLT